MGQTKAALSGLVLAFAASPVLATETTTPIAELRPEVDATISGTVDRIVQYDEFVLEDESGTVRIYIGPNEMPFAVGDQIHVSGQLDDGLSPEFYATQIVLADGQTVVLDRDY